VVDNGPSRREFERLERNVEKQERDIDDLTKLFRDAMIELAGVKATVRFWAGIGSLVGAGIVALAVGLGQGL
jgi:hypothetical protein